MALQALRALTIGVPDPSGASAFYAEFGLRPVAGTAHTLSTADAGEQLRLVHSPYRTQRRFCAARPITTTC